MARVERWLDLGAGMASAEVHEVAHQTLVRSLKDASGVLADTVPRLEELGPPATGALSDIGAAITHIRTAERAIEAPPVRGGAARFLAKHRRVWNDARAQPAIVGAHDAVVHLRAEMMGLDGIEDIAIAARRHSDQYAHSIEGPAELSPSSMQVISAERQVQKWARDRGRIGQALVRRVERGFIRPVFGVRSSGVEQIPSSGPAIIASNHRTTADLVHLNDALGRYHRSMVDARTIRGPAGRAIAHFGGFPIENQGSRSQAGLDIARAVLHKNRPLLIFPEGQRISFPQAARLRTGAVRLAIETGAPIMPVGTASSSGRWSLRPGGVRRTIVVGPPIHLGGMPLTRANIASGTELLAQRIDDAYAVARRELSHPSKGRA